NAPCLEPPARGVGVAAEYGGQFGAGDQLLPGLAVRGGHFGARTPWTLTTSITGLPCRRASRSTRSTSSMTSATMSRSVLGALASIWYSCCTLLKVVNLVTLCHQAAASSGVARRSSLNLTTVITDRR